MSDQLLVIRFGAPKRSGAVGSRRKGTQMDKNRNAVKIVVGGEKWYYQSLCDSTGRAFVRLYDEDGNSREFWDMENAMAWVLEKYSGEFENNKE